MRDKQWTMNCVLTGAAVQRLMDKDDIPAAKKKLEELSSELDPETVKYILHRIVEES